MPVLLLSRHARDESARRGISEDIIRAVAEKPEQVLPVRPGREVRQARVAFPPEAKLYLVRVFVDRELTGETIVTAYRTSKISKYWSAP